MIGSQFPGILDLMSSINKFGANASSAIDIVEDVWDGGGTYPFPITANITHLSEDIDQIADRGLTVEVQGLDAAWDIVVQNKALSLLDTSIPVPLDTPLRRVFRMRVLGNIVAGSDILIKNAEGSVVYGIIRAGNNQTLMAIYTVHRKKIAYMTSYYASVAGLLHQGPERTEIALWVADRDNEYEFQLKHVVGLPKDVAPYQHFFFPYMKITQKSDIKMTSLCSSKPGFVHAGFDLILADA